MKLCEAFDAIRDLHLKRAGTIAFDHFIHGSAAETFARPSIIRGHYPTEEIWKAEAGRGGIYMYVGIDDELLYVGKSCGIREHGAKGSGIAHEAISKISRPSWKETGEFSHYELRDQFRRKKRLAPEATAAVEAGSFYMAFVIIRDETDWSIDALSGIGDDLEGHLLLVHKNKHGGSLPPLNADDDSREVDLRRPWGE